MDLILLRHGKAEDSHAMGDSARALVDKGREQARKAARALKRADMLPDIVLSSPLVRAKQTADEFCDTASISGAITQSWLACGMSPETALKELVGFSEFESVMIVGHEPDFSGLIECLLGISSGSVKMKKGTLACVRIHPPALHGTLRWLIPPKLAEDVD